MIECRRKLMWEAHERFKKSEARNLDDIYNSYSAEKVRAYKYCFQIAGELKCYRYGRFKILGWNSQAFSVGFYGMYDNELVFVYITKDYDRYIKLSDLLALEEKYSNR